MSKKKSNRKSERKNVLETFHVFITVPKHGAVQFQLKDMSEVGVAFSCDPSGLFKEGEEFDSFFYLNAGLRVPLKFKVARIFEEDGKQMVGAEIQSTGKELNVYVKFVNMIDELKSFIADAS